MKPVGSFSKLIGYALVAGCALVWTAKAEPVNGKAVVRAVRGTAQYNLRNQGFKPVKVGMVFHSDTVIRTAPDSQVDLFLGDNGPVLRTTADTDLALSKLTIENIGNEKIIETQLDLRSGRILGNVKKMAQASRYEVKTPRGVAAIRGTEFDIRADGTVIVSSGTVIVTWVFPNGGVVTATINAGQQGTPPSGPGQQPIITNVGPSQGTIDLRDPALGRPDDSIKEITVEIGEDGKVIPQKPGGDQPAPKPIVSAITGD